MEQALKHLDWIVPPKTTMRGSLEGGDGDAAEAPREDGDAVRLERCGRVNRHLGARGVAVVAVVAVGGLLAVGEHDDDLGGAGAVVGDELLVRAREAVRDRGRAAGGPGAAARWS